MGGGVGGAAECRHAPREWGLGVEGKGKYVVRCVVLGEGGAGGTWAGRDVSCRRGMERGWVAGLLRAVVLWAATAPHTHLCTASYGHGLQFLADSSFVLLSRGPQAGSAVPVIMPVDRQGPGRGPGDSRNGAAEAEAEQQQQQQPQTQYLGELPRVGEWIKLRNVWPVYVQVGRWAAARTHAHGGESPESLHVRRN